MEREGERVRVGRAGKYHEQDVQRSSEGIMGVLAFYLSVHYRRMAAPTLSERERERGREGERDVTADGRVGDL